MAAALASAQPTRRRPAPAVRPGPALRVLEGGRRPGELVTPAPHRRAAPAVAGPRHRSARRPARGRQRPSRSVYWRRRVLALAAVALVVVVGWLALVGAHAVLAGDLDPAPGAGAAAAGVGPVYVVQPGDTLWSIATGLAPDGDVRAVVDRLADRSGEGPLQVGQRLPLDGIVP